MTPDLAPELRPALDRAAAEGRTVEVWWRDDDAVSDGPALDRLLALANRHEAPVAVAVVPAALQPSLPARLRGESLASVLVHGWRHANHAAPGAKPSEFTGDRPRARVEDELRRGRDIIVGAFSAGALDVFVPPWNRMAPSWERLLPGAGYAAVSAFGSPIRPEPGSLVRLDTHLDPVDWRTTRSVASRSVRARALHRALAGGGPIGLLTHHLAHDEALWSYVSSVLALLAGHEAVWFRTAAQLLARHHPLSLDCVRRDGLSPTAGPGAEGHAS